MTIYEILNNIFKNEKFELSPRKFCPEYRDVLADEDKPIFYLLKNISSLAKSNPNCIQVYSITGSSDKKFMKQFISDTDFDLLDSLIYTPCSVKYDVFLKTPTAFNATDTMLAEAGYIRPICKPDFDNIEKKYSDMYTGNIWEDDSLVMHSSVDKYYSVLPRIEIRLRYLNMLYNKYQYKSMKNRVDDPKFFQ